MNNVLIEIQILKTQNVNKQRFKLGSSMSGNGWAGGGLWILPGFFIRERQTSSDHKPWIGNASRSAATLAAFRDT
jgi:hypothetical protein